MLFVMVMVERFIMEIKMDYVNLRNKEMVIRLVTM